MTTEEIASALRDVTERLKRIERHLVIEKELSMLGHRVLYDTKSGISTNLPGARTDPNLLDAQGYQVKLS